MTDNVPTTNGNGAASSAMETSPVKNQADELKAALNYIICGKRHLLVHDYTSAVTSLEEATRLFDQIYGPGADECGDAYLYYGIASLELARQETGALDGVISANIHEESDDDEEEGEDGENGEGEEEAEQAGVEAMPEVADVVEGAKTDGEDIDSEEEKPEQAASSAITVGSSNETAAGGSSSSAEPAVAVEPQPGTSNGKPGDEEEDEGDTEATTAEIAWEVLNLAREVFTRQLHKGPEMKTKLAESLQKLGEISIEWENYVNAIDILQECLSLRKEILAADDRLIAETYYHIGVAFSFSTQIEKANDCFRSAISVIEQRLTNLKALIANTVESTDEKSHNELEVIELESLLPEMTLKIEDSAEQTGSAQEALKAEAKQEMEDQVLAAKISQAPSKPANDISHLLKRKRDDTADPSPKKVCPAAGDSMEQ